MAEKTASGTEAVLLIAKGVTNGTVPNVTRGTGLNTDCPLEFGAGNEGNFCYAAFQVGVGVFSVVPV